MIPAETTTCNHHYHLPGRPGEGVMPCLVDHDTGFVRSFWKIEELDDVVMGRAIYVQVHGAMPALRLGLSDPDGNVREMRYAPMAQWQHTGVTSAHFTEAIVAHLMDGGFFALDQFHIPPYPVSVWIDIIPDGETHE